jgi:hypothetical protein
LNLEVWWPTSNTRQNFASVNTNQFIEITEFAKDFTQLKRTPVHLGGPKTTRVAAGGKLATRPGAGKQP